MKFFRTLSLKSKMTAIIMITSSIALVLACAAFIAHELFTFRKDLVQELSTLAEITGKTCAAALNLDRQDDAERTLANLRGAERRLLSSFIFKDGKVWARFPQKLNDRDLPEPPASAGERFEDNSLILYRPIQDPDSHEQIGMIYFRSDLKQMYSRL